jgi:serine/threonine-protein kinase
MTTFEQRLKDLLSHAYDIERELGGGGMSRVFVATDRSLGRKVVIKLLSPELTAEVNRGRFRREIQVAAQLQHPHIVTLLSAGEDGDLVYYTMPFIVGESLKSAVDKHGPLSVRDTVRVLYDVVDALAYAHEQGVVHRDIKPANILRSGSHSLVTDFGVAKALNAAMPSSAMTSTGMAIGTPAYMAPEQLAGDPQADHRIDIYAVGLLAYELLSGKSPFAASSPQGVLAAVLTKDPAPLVDVRPDVPRRLSEMVMQCLSKVPGGRPPSAEALMVALDMFSTASGEIRTREYRVPVIGPTVPVVVAPMAAAAATPTAPTAPAVSTEESAVPLPVPVPITVPAPAFAPAVSTVPAAVAATAGDRTAETLPAYEDTRPSNSRKRYLVGALALLLPAVAGAILLSQRGGMKASATDEPVPAVSDSQASAALSASNASAQPIDSLAIANAVRQRMAEAEAAKGPGQGVVNADSLRRALQRELADSIAKANAVRAASTSAAAVAAAPADAPAPAPAVAPEAPPAVEKRRLAIAEPRENKDQPSLNTFGRALLDALRASAATKEGFALVDQDEVRDAISRTSSRDEAAKLLKPDILVSAGYNGTGEAVNLIVTVWDLRASSSYGIRVNTTRVMPANPEFYVDAVVKSVMKQLDDVARTPTFVPRNRK